MCVVRTSAVQMGSDMLFVAIDIAGEWVGSKRGSGAERFAWRSSAEVNTPQTKRARAARALIRGVVSTLTFSVSTWTLCTVLR
jgi:hypothetical protein